MDLHLSISDGFVKTKIYDKRDDCLNFPFLDGDVPRWTSFFVYIYQLFRFARASSHVDNFNTRHDDNFNTRNNDSLTSQTRIQIS